MKNIEKYQNTSTPRPLTSFFVADAALKADDYEIRMHAKNVPEKKGK